MLTKTKKIFFIATVIYLLVIIGQVAYAIYDNLPVLKSNNYAFDYLYDMVQYGGANETVIGEVASYLLVPMIGAGLAIYMKNSHELYSIVSRIGWSQFFKKSIKYTFWGATILYWLGCLIEMVIINIFYHHFVYQPFAQDILIRGDGYFSLNNLANLVIKTILNGFGWGIFAIFIFNLALFVKKTSLCFFLGPVIGYLITIQESLSGDIGGTVRVLSNIWDITNIMNPIENAMVQDPSPAIYYLNYATTAIFYITLTAVLLRIWYMKNVERG